jgi:hypothetical protein
VKFLKAEKPDYSQFTGVYFYHQKDKALTYYKGLTGVARCFSKGVLESLDYKLWESGIDFRLDGSSQKILSKAGYKPTLIDMKSLGVEVLDVKYADNITPHQTVYKGQSADSISIDLTMFDGLQNYNTNTLRTNQKEVKGRVKVEDVSNGSFKMLPKWVANVLIEKGKYKLAE